MIVLVRSSPVELRVFFSGGQIFFSSNRLNCVEALEHECWVLLKQDGTGTRADRVADRLSG